MIEMLAKLELNIVAEIAAQRRMQKLLDRQLAILLNGKSREFAAVLDEAERSMAESNQLEAERTGLIAAVGAALAIPAKEVTLKKIEERLGEVAGPLSERGDELKACLARIRVSNQQVALLLRHSARFIEDLVALVAGAATQGADGRTYTRTGGLSSAASGAIAAEA